MRIAVAGASGRIGAPTGGLLGRDGHEVVPISRADGVDVYTGEGLDAALEGVDVVVDVTTTNALERDDIIDFFVTAADNLLAAERRAGVGHHVLLSIVNVQLSAHIPHYAGKLAQEERVRAGDTAWSIVRATQFHDFPAMVAGWAAQDGVAEVAPLLLQPVAPDDVAAVLAEVAVGEPVRDVLDVAGPRTEDSVDMARRTLATRGEELRLVPTWRGGFFDVRMAGEVFLPGDDARLGSTSFDDWLAAGGR